MKSSILLIFGLLAGVVAIADGREALPTAPSAQASSSSATNPGKPYKHRVSFPAGTLSYFPGSTITQHGDGLDWNGPYGSVTLTVRRPLDYSGGSVRLTLFHYVPMESDGDISFGIIPVAFSHGSFFETYGGVLTDSIPFPLAGDVLLEQSAVIPPTGLGPFARGDWWYFNIGRHGTFSGKLRLMAVSLDY